MFSKKLGVLALIYVGTIFYTMAAYYHLYMKDNWTFAKAYLLAAPFVLMEYIFSLRGNHYAVKILDWSPLQILVVTTAFYFINIWILNKLVIKQKTNVLRELVAILMVIGAFIVSGVI